MSITNNVARAKTDYDEVYEAGYASTFDGVQANGTRTNYEYAFARWVCPYIKPKHPIVSTSMYWICIYNTELLEAPIISSVDNLGFTSAHSAFRSCAKMVKVGDIKLRSTAGKDAFNATFQYCSALKQIGTITINSELSFSNTFTSCGALEEVTFAGEIKSSGLNLSWSKKLNKASITSIINCLSTTTSGLSVTLSLTAVKTAFNTTDPETCAEWKALEATKSNWTITLSDS